MSRGQNRLLSRQERARLRSLIKKELKLFNGGNPDPGELAIIRKEKEQLLRPLNRIARSFETLSASGFFQPPEPKSKSGPTGSAHSVHSSEGREATLAFHNRLVKGPVNILDGVSPIGSVRRSIPILNTDCVPISGTKPLVCPRADPKPPIEPSLPKIAKRFRSLTLIGPDQTILWVGRQGNTGTVCAYGVCDCFARSKGRRPDPQAEQIRDRAKTLNEGGMKYPLIAETLNAQFGRDDLTADAVRDRLRDKKMTKKRG